MKLSLCSTTVVILRLENPWFTSRVKGGQWPTYRFADQYVEPDYPLLQIIQRPSRWAIWSTRAMFCEFCEVSLLIGSKLVLQRASRSRVMSSRCLFLWRVSNRLCSSQPVNNGLFSEHTSHNTSCRLSQHKPSLQWCLSFPLSLKG